MSGPDEKFSGFVLDHGHCSRLSLEEKRELVHEIARWSEDAPEILRSFSRRELLELICAEMGRERKYTGYTKLQMIENLLNLVSCSSKRRCTDNFLALSRAETQTLFKRPRKKDTLLQLPSDLNPVEIQFCQNVACQATLSPKYAFCKRCSCCICHRYDDNKDPSLWLTCDSDSLDGINSCGLSCHLICAMKHERAGIMKGSCRKLDGCFSCVSCGKINGLMRTWRKQLLIAKEARRVDVLCLRISLCHKMLIGTKEYKEVQKSVETAVKLLQNEVGALDQVCTKMMRGIVNRLSCGAKVQKLCTSAVEAFDSMSCDPYPDYMVQKEAAIIRIAFEESSPTSVIIVLEYEDHLLKDFLGCRLWHRKSTVKDYPDKPTFIVLRPEKRFKITGIDPTTEYFCKASLFSNTGVLCVSEAKWFTPTPTGNFITADKHGKVEHNVVDQVQCHKGFYSLPPFVESVCPSTPCKSNGRAEVKVLCFKRQPEETEYEYCVRVVKLLEREGHIDEDFRVKFLTWFSLKATVQERRVVDVFVEALIDDPPSLAGQLIHTFMDEICCEQKPVSQHAFCMRLWH